MTALLTKPIIAALVTACLIAALHLRALTRPDRRYPFYEQLGIALSGFALWAAWDGMMVIPMVILLFAFDITCVLLIADVIFPAVVLWRANRRAAAPQGEDRDDAPAH